MAKILKFFFCVLVLGMICGGFPAQAQFSFLDNLQSPLIGEKAPGFELKDLNGRSRRLADLSQGRDTILFFWATWCPHCREQLQELKAKADELKADGATVLLVDLGEGTARVAAYLNKNNLSFEVLLDEDGEVSESYKVYGIPTFVFIDKTGEVRRVENYLPMDYKASFLPLKKK